MVAVSSTAEVVAAMGRARDVSVSAYMLHGGPVLRALEDAARRGAHVVVRLEGAPFGDAGGALARLNRRTVDDLRDAGADAALGHLLHAKAIDVDGTLYLDGKNWGESDLVVRETDGDAPATRKHEALLAEASLLDTARAGDAVIVESETFASGNPVYAALDRLARAGQSPRLLVRARQVANDPRERASLERLRRDGVEVRTCDDSEKLAVVGGAAWIGSANATWDDPRGPGMTDWGLRTNDPGVTAAARDRAETAWKRARPLAAG